MLFAINDKVATYGSLLVVVVAAGMVRSSVAQTVEICSFCRCLENAKESSIIVDCFESSRTHRQRPSHYFDLRNMLWPVTPEVSGSQPPSVRAFFKDLSLRDLPIPFETRGIRQGVGLSCMLFNIALAVVIRRTVITKGSQLLGFADDFDTIARSLAKAETVYARLEAESRCLPRTVIDDGDELVAVKGSLVTMDNNTRKVIQRGIKKPVAKHISASQQVVELSFQNVHLETLPTEPFRNVRNLETLTISGNNLQTIENDFFAFQNKLHRLDLTNNTLVSLNALERSRFETLEFIDLSYNKLGTVSRQLLYVLQNVSIIRLENCDIYSWDCPANTRWKVLDLDWNHLTDITTKTFSGLEQLEALYLSHNNIRIVNPQAFEDLHHLVRLDLSHNEIFKLGHNLILPKAVEIINLANNSIERWPFEKLSEVMRVINIEHNGLSEIDPDLPVNVRILNASNNRLRKFSGELFPDLIRLDLSDNLLDAVPSSLWPNLTTLTLDGNPMDRIFFENPTTLKVLSLNRMPNLVELEASAFTNLAGADESKERDCVEIHIAGCPNLRRIDPKAFEEASVCKLDLSNNQLTSIPEELIEWKSLYGGVNLQGNPLDCSCTEQWLVDVILSQLYDNADLQYLLDDLRCHTPLERRGQRLVKYLHHRGAFCGVAKMERLRNSQDEDEVVKASFGSLGSILCSSDDENCLHVHKGTGLIAALSMMLVTLILSVVMVVFILVRRRNERRKVPEGVLLMPQFRY
ncbi:toll-like receptor 7 [Sabethes cyaneus]|uniref:toll-like receptor 7 n=1 Tax=Sabethes cyaneus TaxID=53552 RepID=UPI00237D3D81|nr:toll-like receptor 7 [Sabethes cyaneus]